MKKGFHNRATCFSFFIIMSFVMSACSHKTMDTQEQDSAAQVMPDSIAGNMYVSSDSPFVTSVVTAINVGGEQYAGLDGVTYEADNLDIETFVGRTENIKGSQDPTLFKSYRKGDMAFSLPLADGLYDVTLKFAEPDDMPVGEREFDVWIDGKKQLSQLDIRLARDGRIASALERTIANIPVSDGRILFELKPVTGEPVLHGLVIRKKVKDQRDWQLVWGDEFNYQGQPDPDKWSFDIWPARKVNDEDQTYTDRAKNVRVENGHLVIEAHKEAFANAEYTSGRIHSSNKGDFLYGKAEIRARIPTGQGTWSAIWMLPSDPYKYSTTCQPGEDWQGSQTCDAWPNSGEIDIMEYVGYDPSTIHGTVHNKAYYWMNWEQRKGSIEVDERVNQEFQTYALEWGPDYLYIAFNDTPYFFYRNEGTGWRAWPFDHPYHLILNLAIGGEWGRAGGPIDNSLFPVRMEVDYVRVYQLGKH